MDAPSTPQPDPSRNHGSGATARPQPSRTRRIPRWPIALVVLVLLVGGVWRSRGFEPAASRRISFTAGERLELGPLALTVTQARAMLDHDDAWKVRVEGTCQATVPEGFSLHDKEHWLFGMGSNTATPLVADNYRLQLDPKDRSLLRGHLAGGLPPMPCHVESKMPKGFDPKTGIIFAVQSMDWRDNSILGDQGEDWHSGRDTYRTTMPVTVVKDLYQ